MDANFEPDATPDNPVQYSKSSGKYKVGSKIT